MKPVPLRHSLIEATAAVLLRRIAAGEWSRRLPGEIELASFLQVGRNTLRTALAILEAEGCLCKTAGRRWDNAALRSAAEREMRRLCDGKAGTGLPTGDCALHRGHTSPTGERWLTFQVFVEPEIYRGTPGARLESLTSTLPGAVWILHRSTPAMQRWFQDRGVRAVLAGSRHEGIHLRRVEIDYRAISRHAAGRFLARGHHRLAVLRPVGHLAGDAECVAAFREGVGHAEVIDLRCRAGTLGITEVLRLLVRRPLSITGLYVLHADNLELLCPEPTRYRYSIRALSARLAAVVTNLHGGSAGKNQPSLVLPSLIKGETLADAKS